MAETKLFLQGAPLPVNFHNDPQGLYEAILDRVKVYSPNGIVSFVVGTSQPDSDQGPWLKNGSQWWVWSPATSTYVPVDISASYQVPFTISETTPATSVPNVWLKVSSEASGRRPIGWYYYSTAATPPGWKSTDGITRSGTTANRPTNPEAFEKYYDTTISCEIWWERGAWRTVGGSLGDIKIVRWPTLTVALAQNPGWEELGGEVGTSWRGRAIIPAHKDKGGSPVTSFTPLAGITARAQDAVFGEENHTLIKAEMPSHEHTITPMQSGAVGSSGNTAYRSDIGGTETTSTAGGDNEHNNIQPTVAAWFLVKV